MADIHKTDRRVVFDMTYAAKSHTGTRVFAYQLKEALEAIGKFEIITLSAPSWGHRRENEGNPLTGVLNMAWMQCALPVKLAALRADLFHAPAFLSPLIAPCPVLLNVFDTIYLMRPQDFNYKSKLHSRLVIGPAVKRATAVITLSQYSKDRIQEAYGLLPEKIEVIYPGVSPRFRPDCDLQAISAVRRKYGLANSYILFVGASEKRKNLVALVEAVAQIKKDARYAALQLALVGPRGRGWADLTGAIERESLGETVLCLGLVPDRDLPFIYAGASLFAFPSLVEGFGLPLIEAMASGVPIVATACPPTPEVVGDAAWLAEGTDAKALAAAMERVLSDENLARELKRKGLERVRQFTWERAGHQTLALYDRILSRSSKRSRK